MSSFENNVYILYKHAFWSKSSVKELKSHLLLFCLSAVLFVLQCLSAYVHDINTEDMELENNSTELWQYQHLNNNLLPYTFTITKYIAREGIHTCAWSDQVHLRSLFMLHVWVDYVQVFSYKYFLAHYYMTSDEWPTIHGSMLPLLPLLQWVHLLWKSLHCLLYATSQKITPLVMVVEKLGLDLSPPRLLYESLVPGASVPGTRLALTHPSSSSYVLYTFFTMPTYPTIPMSASVTTGLELSSLLANLTTCNKQILVHLRNVSCMIQAAKVQDSTKRTIFFSKAEAL